MSTLTINNAAIQTYPTKKHCYRGRWECEDSVHDCPGKCGYVRYKDQYGNIVEEDGFCITDTNIQIVASEIIQVIGLITEVCDFVPQSQYNISTEFTCTDNGWENGATGGTATCQGIKTVKISDLLGVTNGFIRFQYINNSNEVGLTKEDGSQLNIGEVLPISQMLMATTYAQCSNVYPCTPSINSGTYIIQYSPNGMDNWINSNLNVI